MTAKKAEPRDGHPCVIGAYCVRHEFIHGAEAEELRERIEKLIADGCDGLIDLQGILDSVDARDSVAYVEVRRGLAPKRKAGK